MRLLSPQQTFTVVVRHHERFYAPLLGDALSARAVIQPENRGTAPAILYGLLRLHATTPEGSVAIFPSDHYISNDEAFIAHVDRAFEVVQGRPDVLVLLGIIPDGAEMGYGWIEPGERLADALWPDVFRVRRFWEKPTSALAQALLAGGCLWNSFVMVAKTSMLLALIRSTVPDIFESFEPVLPRLTTPWEEASIRQLYSRLPPSDFSRQVLAVRPAALSVLPLKGVGWSDLGEPCRVMTTLARIGEYPEWAADGGALRR
jgi:mannose-1-phosphate guanylyltransferase